VYVALIIVLLVVGVAAWLVQPGVEVVERVEKKELPPERIEKEPIVEKAAAGPAEGAKPQAPKVSISFNEDLAKKGIKYFQELGCVACHTVKTAGIAVGGNVGPDLSLALLGSPGVEPGSAGGPIMMKWFAQNGLSDPAKNLDQAVKLLEKFLCEVPPSDLAPTMNTQIKAFRSTHGDKWCSDYVPALVEMLKMAAAKASG